MNQNVSMKFTLDQFEGPLDVLLTLIAEEKLDISEVSLSKVTEQYLRFIEETKTIHPDDLADFLLVAARLLLMKACKLIPDMTPEEADGPSLEEQLRLYRAFIAASKQVTAHWMSPNHAVFRQEPPRRPASFSLPNNVSLATLTDTMIQLVNRLKPSDPLPKLSIDRGISIREKIAQIRHLLSGTRQVSFHDLLGDRGNRTDVIVSFLALLDLMKENIVQLKQTGTFGDIHVLKV